MTDRARRHNTDRELRYRAADFFLLRAATLPSTQWLSLLEACTAQSPTGWPTTYEQGLRTLLDQPAVAAALALAAPDLVDALAAPSELTNRERERDRRRAVAALGRYINRMSVRPTPLGLIAGVADGRFGEQAQAPSYPKTVLAEPSAHRPYARMDMGWILHLHKALADPDALPAELPVVVNDLAHIARGRVWLADSDAYGEQEARSISVRASAPVRLALSLAAVPQPLGELRAAITEEFRTAQPEQIDGLLRHLMELGVLVTAQRPPLVQSDGRCDPARLLPEAALSAHTAELEALGVLLEEFNQTAGTLEAPSLQRAVRGLVREMTPGYAGTHSLQIDTRLSVADGSPVLPAEAAGLAEQAAHAIAVLGLAVPYPGTLRTYAECFVERYGAGAEIPVLELLCEETGLGAPPGYQRPERTYPLPGQSAPRTTPAVKLRERLLARMALDAAARGSVQVDLDEGGWWEELAQLRSERDGRIPLPAMDIHLQLAPPGPGQERWRAVVCGSAVAYAGRTFARFEHLLSAEARTGLAALAAAESAYTPSCIVAELGYIPASARVANVAIRAREAEFELPVNIATSLPEDRVVRPRDIVVGVRENRLYLRSLRHDRELLVVQHSMLNPLLAPNLCRFLLEVSATEFYAAGPFDWAEYDESLPFLPRLVRGDVVLRRARWMLRTEDIAADENALRKLGDAEFRVAVEDWRRRWSVPSQVYLTFGDNYILLDLDAAPSLADLRDELTKSQGGVVRMEEVLPALEAGQVRDASGHAYAAEYVIPVVLEGSEAQAAAKRREVLPPRSAVTAATPEDRIRPVGSDWLFISLYGEPDSHDFLLVDEVRSFAQDLEPLTEGGHPFFLRYGDPAPHLRLRFPASDPRRRAELAARVIAWADRLLAEERIVDFTLSTYRREIERYGGVQCIEDAERLFQLDSAVCVQLLGHLASGASELPRPVFVALSLDRLVRSLLPTVDEVRAVARSVGGGTDGGELYREWSRQIWQADTVDGVERKLLAELEAVWREPGGAFAHKLGHLEAARQLTAGRHDIVRSLMHMHCNRMGLRRDDERACYGVWRRLTDRRANMRQAATTGADAS
jgi:thiopeptide-type bacteriocin biosynthesis protein